MIDDLLSPLAALPEVSAASARIAQAVRPVRFSTGLRKRWKEARTEASVRAAARDVERAGRTVGDLRREIVNDGSPSDEVARMAWLCHSDCVGFMPDLNLSPSSAIRAVPARKVLSSIRRDAGQSLEGEREIAENDLLVSLAESGQPAVVTTALMVGQWALSSVPGDGIVRDAFLRWYLVSRGLEPTGIALPDWDRLSVRDYASGEMGGMKRWIDQVADEIVSSMSGALAISTSILAGRTDTGYL